jgi:hypothetical protein
MLRTVRALCLLLCVCVRLSVAVFLSVCCLSVYCLSVECVCACVVLVTKKNNKKK